MSKKPAYFKDFLDNPSSFMYAEFFSMLREWAKYITDHKDEFNYLEDDEWSEIRERICDAIQIKEDIKEEFEDVKFKVESLDENSSDRDKIAIQTEWLEFMKKNQAEYKFSDSSITSLEKNLKSFADIALECEILSEKTRIAEMKLEEAIDNLENTAFEHYERTGKIPVITTIRPKKDYKGN